MKKIINKILLLTSLIFIGILFFGLNQVVAQETTTTNSGYQYYVGGWEIIPKECIDPNTPSTTQVDGKTIPRRCDANSFVQLFVNLANIMLKLSPPLAVLIIIYGGFRFIGSRGKQESIQTGKKILSSAFIGLAIIIFLGWTLTFFIIQAITGVKAGTLFQTVANPAGQAWWNPSKLTSNNNDATLDLQCCVVPNNGCVMRTESQCIALGGNRDSNFTETCTGNTICANIAATLNCCIGEDVDNNGKPDVCYSVLETDLAGCLQYANSTPSASQVKCPLDNIECEREY